MHMYSITSVFNICTYLDELATPMSSNEIKQPKKYVCLFIYVFPYKKISMYQRMRVYRYILICTCVILYA